MEHYVLNEGQWQAATADGAVADNGLHWLVFSTDEADWAQTVAGLSGLAVHENHVKDSLNPLHPPAYEISTEYEVLIVPSLTSLQHDHLHTANYTFIITDTVLVTIRPPQCTHYATMQERLLRRKSRFYNTLPSLIYLMIDTLADVKLSSRIAFSNRVENWQEKFVGNKGEATDWQSFFLLQRQLNHLINQCEMEWDATDGWLGETEIQVEEHERIRFKDVLEHLRRFSDHLKNLRSDSDNLLQIYFSLTQEKTNRVVQVLTIISVIFLPLNLIAGIFGMNFAHIPLLQSTLGFWLTMGGMVTLAGILVLTLRRLHWI